MKGLDLKTELFLHLTRAKKVKVSDLDPSKIEIKEEKRNIVYVFDSYKDYYNYFKKYLKKVDEELIAKAIYTTGEKGQVVALKGLCERIIIKQRAIEINNTFDKETKDIIPNGGKIKRR